MSVLGYQGRAVLNEPDFIEAPTKAFRTEAEEQALSERLAALPRPRRELSYKRSVQRSVGPEASLGAVLSSTSVPGRRKPHVFSIKPLPKHHKSI